MAALATSDALSGAAIQDSMRPKMLRVDRRCRLDELALRLFGDRKVARVICTLNPNLSPATWLEAGQRLFVPNAEPAWRNGNRLALEQNDWAHKAKCLRLVKGGDDSERAPIDSSIGEALRSGCSPNETAAYVAETSTGEMISAFLQEMPTTDFAMRVKAELHNRCISARTCQALRWWCGELAHMLSPKGWLFFLQSMTSSPNEMSSWLRALALPEPLILVARRLAPIAIREATRCASITLGPGAYGKPSREDQTAALSAEIPLQISLALGSPLMHPMHLTRWGSEELYRQFAKYFRSLGEAFAQVEREWDVLPVELKACFSQAEAGAVPISSVQGNKGRILKVFANLQANYASKTKNGECKHWWPSAALATDTQVAPKNLRSWHLAPSQAPNDELAQAITHRLASELIRFIDEGSHRWLCQAYTSAGEIHPRRVRTMLTTSSDLRPDTERICAFLETWFRTQPERRGQSQRKRRSPHTPDHIYAFAKSLNHPISGAGCHLSDYGVAALLASCAQSRWESSWMHPDVDEALTLSLLNRFAPKVLRVVEKQIAHRYSADTHTKAPERARGFAYALRA